MSVGAGKAVPPSVTAKLGNGTLTVQAHGLNLIELLGIEMSAVTQTIGVPMSIVGVDAGGNTITLMDGTVTFNVVVKNGTAKGVRAAP